jgi:hypothetical protein
VAGDEPNPPPITPEDQNSSQPPPEAPEQPITIVHAPATPASPDIVENAAPAEAAPAKQCVEPAPREPVYALVALRDGWVYAAVAYWVEGDTLHYITTNGDHNQVSLKLVDRKISARLNQTLQIVFILP